MLFFLSPLADQAARPATGHTKGAKKQSFACAPCHRPCYGRTQLDVRGGGRNLRCCRRASRSVAASRQRFSRRTLACRSSRPLRPPASTSAWQRGRAERMTSGTVFWAARRRAVCWACEVRLATAATLVLQDDTTRSLARFSRLAGCGYRRLRCARSDVRHYRLDGPKNARCVRLRRLLDSCANCLTCAAGEDGAFSDGATPPRTYYPYGAARSARE